jgi:hypothetical protein
MLDIQKYLHVHRHKEQFANEVQLDTSAALYLLAESEG